MKADFADDLAGRERSPQGLKPTSLRDPNGTAEAVPYPKPAYETASKDLRQQLKETLQGRVRLMGLGNIDCGDDGFGVHLAEELREAGVPDVVVAGTNPEHYVRCVPDQGFDCLVFLDAVAFGAPPGSVVLMDATEISIRYPQISTHKISLGVLAKYVRAGGRATVWLLGVQPESIRLGQTLTPPVRATLELLKSLLLEVTAGKDHVGTAALSCPADESSAEVREEEAVTAC